MLVQLVPLPAAIADRLSPVDRVIRQSLSLTPVLGGLPLSVDPSATVRAIALGGGAMIVFVIGRQVFAGGGVRIAARGIAMVGLVLAAISLAQDATAHGLMYWRWDPGEGPPPFGPFLNRNHFATWIVMAAPVCLGYLLAHAAAHPPRQRRGAIWHQRLLQLFDARSIWLSASICLMLVALVASMSRAGFVGLVSAPARGRLSAEPAGGLAGGHLGRLRDRRGTRRGGDSGQPRGCPAALRSGGHGGGLSHGHLARDDASGQRLLAHGHRGWYV